MAFKYLRDELQQRARELAQQQFEKGGALKEVYSDDTCVVKCNGHFHKRITIDGKSIVLGRCVCTKAV